VSLDEVAKSLGIPGIMLCFWYLLELRKDRRAEKAEDAKNKLEARRLELEEARIQAMTAGFQLLAAKIDEHQRDEFEHHATTREAIVGLHTSLANHFDLTPPPQEPPKPRRGGTPPKGVESSGYHFHRPGTKGSGG
jgi:hypothetical protein